MFFEGSLHQGIGAAIQQKKKVVCFVHDDSEQSISWREDYLSPLAEPLADHAIVLQIAQGSQEAGFLSAISPIENAPMVVVISSGQVKGALRPPMTIDEFRNGLFAAMDLNFSISRPQAPRQGGGDSSPQQSAPATTSQEGGAASTAEEETLQGESLGEPSWEEERRQRMQQLEAEREADGKRRAEAARKAAQEPGSRAAYHAKLQEEARKRQKAQADERQRILDNIEADRRERRRVADQRAEDRAQTSEAQLASPSGEQLTQGTSSQQRNQTSVSGAALTQRSAQSSAKAAKSRLQLRLPDGQLERTEFPANNTLASVRSWVAGNTGIAKGDRFVFRHVVGTGAAPQFTEDEETRTLADLGLAPSATLVVRLVPVSTTHQGAAGALLSIILAGPRWLWNLLVSIVLVFLSLLPRPAGTSAADASGNRRSMDHDTIGRSTGAQTNADVRTGEERRRKDKPNLYNGNQTSVLPNDDDEGVDKSK